MKTENAIKISADELYLKTVAKDTHQKKTIKGFLLIWQIHLAPKDIILTVINSLMRNSQVDNVAINHCVTTSERMSYKVMSLTFFWFIRCQKEELVRSSSVHMFL